MSDKFRIERSVSRDEERVTFAVYENEGGGKFEDGSPRAALDVTLWRAHDDAFGGPRETEISWPSTSDKRPALARALAEALVLAADEAER